MSGTQLNACLFLLLVAVSVHCIYGGDIGDTCTSTSDCSYDQASCFKYDQCEKGKCSCKKGYTQRSGGCVKAKNIGESCSGANEDCLFASCKDNICTCPSSAPASDDKKICGRMYDESCNTGQCFIYFTCQSGKCGCSSSKKTYTYGEYTVCVDKDAIVDLKAGESCDNENNRHCKSGLHCDKCPGTTNNVCLSGATQVSVSLLALGGLLMTAILTKFY